MVCYQVWSSAVDSAAASAGEERAEEAEKDAAAGEAEGEAEAWMVGVAEARKPGALDPALSDGPSSWSWRHGQLHNTRGAQGGGSPEQAAPTQSARVVTSSETRGRRAR